MEQSERDRESVVIASQSSGSGQPRVGSLGGQSNAGNNSNNDNGGSNTTTTTAPTTAPTAPTTTTATARSAIYEEIVPRQSEVFPADEVVFIFMKDARIVTDTCVTRSHLPENGVLKGFSPSWDEKGKEDGQIFLDAIIWQELNNPPSKDILHSFVRAIYVSGLLGEKCALELTFKAALKESGIFFKQFFQAGLEVFVTNGKLELLLAKLKSGESQLEERQLMFTEREFMWPSLNVSFRRHFVSGDALLLLVERFQESAPLDRSVVNSKIRDAMSEALGYLKLSFKERDEACGVLLLSYVMNEHTLLLGKPGTGKTQLARRMCDLVERVESAGDHKYDTELENQWVSWLSRQAGNLVSLERGEREWKPEARQLTCFLIEIPPDAGDDISPVRKIWLQILTKHSQLTEKQRWDASSELAQKELLPWDWINILGNQKLLRQIFQGQIGVQVELAHAASRGSAVLAQRVFFQTMLTKFSLPDELLGPVDIKKLFDTGQHELRDDGYLPRAKVAFLDEIFKADSGVLNCLLNVLDKDTPLSLTEPTKLRLCVGASNESPTIELSPLVDRFLFRCWIEPVKAERLLPGNAGNAGDAATSELFNGIFFEELQEVVGKFGEIAKTVNVDDILPQLVSWLDNTLGDLYISGRRMRKLEEVLKYVAAMNGRKSVVASDCWMLRYCFWGFEKHAFEGSSNFSEYCDTLKSREAVETALIEYVKSKGEKEFIDSNIFFSNRDRDILHGRVK